MRSLGKDPQSSSNIHLVCKGKNKSAYGFKWEVEYDTAIKLIDLGLDADGLWYLTTMDGFSGTCYYYPMTNFLSAQRGLYMGTEDEIALEVAMLPTREAKYQYLKSIQYGARGGHCDFD